MFNRVRFESLNEIKWFKLGERKVPSRKWKLMVFNFLEEYKLQHTFTSMSFVLGSYKIISEVIVK